MEIFIVLFIIICCYIAYIGYIYYKDNQEITNLLKNKPKKEEEPQIEFTREKLALYDGKTQPQAYLCCKNIVFDVSNSEFYTPGGPYHHFAGKDCSMAFAKFSEEEKYFQMNLDYEGLNLGEKENLESWFSKLYFKYKIVGKLIV